MNKIKTTIQTLFTAGLLVFPSLALAVTDAERCKAFKDKFKGIFDTMPAQYCSASSLLMWVLQFALVMSGTVAVLFIILGGFWYLTSAGNDEQAEKGQKTLTNAVIGLVVIVLAATIVRIVANTLTMGK